MASGVRGPARDCEKRAPADIASDEQKRALVKGITNLIHEVGQGPGESPPKNVPVERVHLVIREECGLHFAFGGDHVPEFEPGAD